ncbi:MAG: hypothetical protein DWI57_13185 [Chloroflexi bacterium]|nr:MAG: hypothetical protein DWI57_13185 [Chloroflexota bacterium]
MDEIERAVDEKETGIVESAEEPEEEENEEDDPFATWVAILIAVVTLVGAWVGWDIGTVYGEAFGEQAAGLGAALNVESTLTYGTIGLYKEYRVYTEYTRYQTLAELQAEADESASADTLIARKNDDADLAAVQLPFFLTRYLNRDGVYDRKRQLGEAWAEAAQRIDLEPAPHFEAADVWQAKTEALVALFIVLGSSLFFLTLAGALNPQRKFWRYTTATVGTLLMIFSIVAQLWIERG